MIKILPQRGRNLPNLYLAGFSLLVMVSLILASFLFWDANFKKTLQKKTEGLSSIISQRPEQAEPEVILSFNPRADVFQVGEDFEVELLIDGLGREIWGADLRLAFDPEVLVIKKVSAGDFFTNPLVLENQINKDQNQVWFSVGSLKAAIGKGTLAVLEVRPLKVAETGLSFSAGTQVALKGKDVPAIVDRQPLILTVVR